MSPLPFTINPFLTRSDAQAGLISLLSPLLPHASPRGALFKLGTNGTHYDERAAQLEGFARPLWGIASLLAGGGEWEGVRVWKRGLVAGTDPESEEYWGATRGKDQRMVEMSPIGYALALTPETFWNELSAKQKANVEVWLNGLNAKEMPDTNWLWFRVFANLGLRKVGAYFDAERMKMDLDHLDGFYEGDGFSRDGPEGVRQLDYYSGSFAIQTAQLIYSKLANDTDPDRCESYRQKAREYAVAFVHMSDEDGRLIGFGRSLVYRFAMSAFWGAAAFADLELPAPLSWGVVKGLLLRNLRYWSKQEIFNSDGVLTIGYTYANTFMTENYNSNGSSYWCCKAFIPLACPADHPFWTSQELPFPTQQLPQTVALVHPGHIITSSGGHTFLLSSGQACHYPLRHSAAKYGKFAYSSAFGYSVPTGALEIEQHAADSTLALSDDSGEHWRVRRVPLDARIVDLANGGKALRSAWRPWKDVEVETWLVPPTEGSLWHVRVHRLRSGRELRSADGAFAIHGQERSGRALAAFKDPSHPTGEGSLSETAQALAASSAGVVGIFDISPSSSRAGQVVLADANSNIVASRSVIPTLIGEHEAGTHDVWLWTAVLALPSRVGVDGAKGWEKEWAARVERPSLEEA